MERRHGRFIHRRHRHSVPDYRTFAHAKPGGAVVRVHFGCPCDLCHDPARNFRRIHPAVDRQV